MGSCATAWCVGAPSTATPTSAAASRENGLGMPFRVSNSRTHPQSLFTHSPLVWATSSSTAASVLPDDLST